MENPPIDPWLAAYQLSIFLASIIVWVQLFGRWRRRGVILDYEPRRPVPWGPIAVVPAMAFMLLALGSGQTPQGVPADEVAIDPSDAVVNILASSFLQLVLTGMVVGVAVMSQATARDLGIPTSPRQLADDVGIGAVACLAAIAPVHLVQGLLLFFLQQEEPSRHPLVKMLTDGEVNLLLMIAASAAAVVVAPLCEEIIYRLMLQGWLEKWEESQVGMAEEGTPDESTIQAWNTDLAHSSKPLVLARPVSRGIFGLPYGWTPVLISSTLFAFAHFGYGPEPVPIFLLALILGYVYQRTHRILPTIVAHSLFNLVTMLALWRMVLHPMQ